MANKNIKSRSNKYNKNSKNQANLKSRSDKYNSKTEKFNNNSNNMKNNKKNLKNINNKKRNKKRKIRIAILCFILAILLIGIFLGGRYLVKHQPKVKQPKKQVEEKVNKEVDDPKLEEVKKLYQENNDLYGWITIDDTKIDYPVMYTKDEDYYLDKDFYKKKSSAGSLFIDKYNTIEPRDINLLIHGHSMKDGSMFRALINYKSKSYYEKHKTFTFYTTKEKEEYEIIAVFVSQVYQVSDKVFKYYKFYNATNEDDYNDYIKNIKKLSLFDIEATAKYPDKLITLSTCEYSKENGRMVVVGRKI